jgi:serine/threonine protein kinase
VATHDGVFYVVSELLEGETLRERLAESPIPARKAIDYAIQIARGLVIAHAKGIVHRDLKPENLFLTKDGQIKILDFGLAKVTTKAAAAEATSVTTEAINTQPGVVMDTVGYMSPEQVRGATAATADHRSDIFSFGVISLRAAREQARLSGGYVERDHGDDPEAGPTGAAGDGAIGGT